MRYREALAGLALEGVGDSDDYFHSSNTLTKHPESFLITTCCCLCLRSRAFVSETEHEESYITASCRWIPHKSLFGLRQMSEAPAITTRGKQPEKNVWHSRGVQCSSQHISSLCMTAWMNDNECKSFKKVSKLWGEQDMKHEMINISLIMNRKITKNYANT